MEPNSYSIQLDTNRKLNFPLIEITQNDTDAHIFNIAITKNGDKYNLTGCTIVIIFKKPDGTEVIDNAGILNAVDGLISYKLDSQAISAPGTVQAYIQIHGTNGERLTVMDFNFVVKEDPYSDSAIQSENSYPLLQNLISRINAFEPQNIGIENQVITMTENGPMWAYITWEK